MLPNYQWSAFRKNLHIDCNKGRWNQKHEEGCFVVIASFMPRRQLIGQIWGCWMGVTSHDDHMFWQQQILNFLKPD